MNIWLTSDTHYTHNNIIKYCSRPYASSYVMDEALISNWNEVVLDDDIIIHLGDVTLITKPKNGINTVERIKKLKGRKILLPGNHDKKEMLNLYSQLGWRIFDSICVNDVYFSHIPPTKSNGKNNIPAYDKKDYSFIVHGHTHGNFKSDGFIDVGVDSQNYYPVNIDKILDRKTIYSLKLFLKNVSV